MLNAICTDDEKLIIFYEIRGISLKDLNKIKEEVGWSENELILILQQLI